MTNLPKGSIVALITPFHEDGTVNFKKLKELIEWHIAHKTDGILVLGTTGESSTMSHEEDDAVVACAIATADHRIPIIVGAGSNCTQTQLEKSLKYQNMGADGVLLISPIRNAPPVIDGEWYLARAPDLGQQGTKQVPMLPRFPSVCIVHPR